MYTNNVASLAALLALAYRATASGSCNVKNLCSFPVYLESVSEQAGSQQIVSANGGTWSQPWQINGDGGGLSIKMSNDPSMSAITQFEYTLANGLWYDISNINGYPFKGSGLTVFPSVASCRQILCPSTGVCSSAYNVPDDNQATAECDSNASMDIVLCPGDAADSSSSSSSSAQSKPATEAPQPVPQAQAVSTSSTTPAPVITPAPASSAPVATAVAVHTTFVTKVITLELGADGNAMFEVEKRDASHAHGHRNAHRDSHARRHQHGSEQE